MDTITVAFGCDHGGFELKNELIEQLRESGAVCVDLGCFEGERCDYPDYAHLVCEAVTAGKARFGILCCGTGLGMSMAANKHRGIRAACVSDTFSARMARAHNDANVLCLGGRVLGPGLAGDIVRLFLDTTFEGGGRHTVRVAKIMANEATSDDKR